MVNVLTSTDVNECLFQDACGANFFCNNTVGSYRCEKYENVDGRYPSWSIPSCFIKGIFVYFCDYIARWAVRSDHLMNLYQSILRSLMDDGPSSLPQGLFLVNFL